jgi:hypothetical protein
MHKGRDQRVAATVQEMVVNILIRLACTVCEQGMSCPPGYLGMLDFVQREAIIVNMRYPMSMLFARCTAGGFIHGRL